MWRRFRGSLNQEKSASTREQALREASEDLHESVSASVHAHPSLRKGGGKDGGDDVNSAGNGHKHGIPGPAIIQDDVVADSDGHGPSLSTSTERLRATTTNNMMAPGAPAVALEDNAAHHPPPPPSSSTTTAAAGARRSNESHATTSFASSAGHPRASSEYVSQGGILSGVPVPWRRSVSIERNLGSSSRIATAGSKVVTERGVRNLPNGDVYRGSYRAVDGVPHGHGMYTWTRDGNSYEGEWFDGLRHGVGTYRWASGASFKGEWLEGQISGVGKLKGADGSLYVGSWLADRRHGLGKKTYVTGDVYEGIWKNGLPHGPGEYRWVDRSTYSGEWVAGKMEGRGTYVWGNGDRFDGQWRSGVEDGQGAYTWADGSYYEGTWTNGKKTGTGYYIPAPPMPEYNPEIRRSVDSIHSNASSIAGHHSTVHSDDETGDEASSSDSSDDEMGRRERRESKIAKPKRKKIVFRRDYDDEGNIESETKLTHEQSKIVLRKLLRYRDRHGREKKKNKAEAKKQGETIFKGHIAYDMMVCIQLGIRVSVGKVTPLPKTTLTADDFMSRPEDKTDFPRAGSANTPPHPSFDFKWKEYCPMAFRHLRERFDIDAGDYMLSLCGESALRQLASPGKSGALFYCSHDDRFLIKTVRKHEMKLLRDLLPMYYKHVMENRDTLLTKFFGLYRLKPLHLSGSRMAKAAGGSRTVRFVVMNNLFCTDLRIHRRFDLKGSTQGRATDQAKIAKLDENTILKDLDLDVAFALEEGKRAKLLRQISIDCALLEELKVMDYSLLLGVHYRDLSNRPLSEEGSGERPRASTINMSYADRKHFFKAGAGGASPPPDVADIARGRSLSVTAKMMPEKSRGFRPVAGAEGSSDFLAKASGKSLVTLGQTMAASALPSVVRFAEQGETVEQLDVLLVNGFPTKDGDAPIPPGVCGSPVVVAEPSLGTRDVVLYFGIIDILQMYNGTKRIETAFKALMHNRNTISAVDPKTYSARFQSFLGSLFK
eukprot:CAMPEP_0119207026 /NCGR_PEP_ID=MMETSP1316-20130426/40686_1 /TAXON_ID=41880 /ORGANISM="Pycnococcus provasolii, Strain RCC2336" /LENGTH=997 /DNA_ID=CAMNT_0007203429 /DNA_START=127 /DNA_END=3120 /DNA_ORIENTATION=+